MNIINQDKIKRWSAEELIHYIFNQLNQNSTFIQSGLEALTNEDIWSCFNDEQKKFFDLLRQEADNVRALAEIMSIWSLANSK